MRVLITTDTVGGVWTFTRQLTSDLLQRGHQVALVSFGRMPSESQSRWGAVTCAAFGKSFCYIPSEAPLEWMQENEHAYSAALPALSAAIDRTDPEVLLSSQFCFGKLPIAIPKVVVAHSDVLSWSKSCGKAPLPASDWLNTYLRLVGDGLEQTDAVVAPTHWMLAALAEHFTLPQHALVILNGRTLEHGSSPPAKKLQAATAGRFWDEAKNLSVLEQFESPVPILLAGSYALGSTKGTLNSASVTLLDELSEADVLSLFLESSIYLCSSIYEPFGLAPVEAALCGCAVVANDIPSLREVWGECASFYQDVPSLRSILQMLTDPRALQAAQARSLERARMLSSSRMTERYLNLFERLLQSSRSGRSAHAA
jgi:glycogen(starch) synthase